MTGSGRPPSLSIQGWLVDRKASWGPGGGPTVSAPSHALPASQPFPTERTGSLLGSHRLEREGEGAWEPEAWLGAQLCDTRILEKVAEGPGHWSLPGQLGTGRGSSGFTTA